MDTIDEALDVTQRRARARNLKKFKSRIKIGREKAMRKFAGMDKLKKRARVAARKAILAKLMRGKTKDELTYQKRQELEKRIDKMKGVVDRIAKKLLPIIIRKEKEKKMGN